MIVMRNFLDCYELLTLGEKKRNENINKIANGNKMVREALEEWRGYTFFKALYVGTLIIIFLFFYY